jgi:hypothetical protein
MSARDPFFNFESVVRDHLRGELFATGADVDAWFKLPTIQTGNVTFPSWPKPKVLAITNAGDKERIQSRIVEHIRWAPAREREALLEWSARTTYIHHNSEETRNLAFWWIYRGRNR